MELDMIGIGERIKTRRKELKLSQTDIYERCDITSGALSKIENGKTTPSVIAFYKLSQVLECDMNWLATGISSNMQKSNICKLEEELLNGFRELPEDDKEELMGLLQLKLRKVKKEKDVTAKSEFPLRSVEDVPFLNVYEQEDDEVPFDISDIIADRKARRDK